MEDLKLGSHGPDVRMLQDRLDKLGFGPVEEDGLGVQTEAAIRSFQRANDLADDGVVGPSTRSALYALRRGDSGPPVVDLQKKLQKWLPKRLRERRRDIANEKDFGTATENAVREFQQEQGIRVDGVANSRTCALLGIDTAAESFETILDEELRVIRKGRADATTGNLVGLAFSGGGIRSATFGLGVLEGLKRFSLLGSIDYLSTVSGGGFLGAWLSANCRRAKDRAEEKDKGNDKENDKEKGKWDWLDKDTQWDKSIAHLRRYSNYLSPQVGFFSADTWSMATVWLRNTLLIQLTVVFAIALALLLPRPLLHWFSQWPYVGEWRWLTVIVFVTGVAGIASNQVRSGNPEFFAILDKDKYCWGFAILGAVLIAVTILLVAPLLQLDVFANVKFGLCETFGMLFIALVLVVGGFFLMPALVRVFNWFLVGLRKFRKEFPYLVSLTGIFSSSRPESRKPPTEVDYTQSGVQLLVVIPMLVTGYLVAAVMWGQKVGHDAPFAEVTTYGGFLKQEWNYWPFPLQIALASLLVLSFSSVQWQKGWWKKARYAFAALVATVVSTLVLYLLVCAIMVLLHEWSDGDPDRGASLAFVWAPALVLFAFSLAIAMLIGILGRYSSESMREWWSRLGAWLLIYGVAWMVITVAAVYGPLWAAMLLDGELWGNLTAVGGWLATTVAGLFAGKSSSTGGTPGGEARKSTGNQLKEVVAAVGPFVFIAGLLIGISTCLHLIILNNGRYGDEWEIDRLVPMHWPYLHDVSICLIGVAIAVVVAGTVILTRYVDINVFSLNAFYRNRLVRCYLGATRELRRPHNFTGFDQKDDLPLAHLLVADTAAGPFHIVNCALNLGGSSDLELHTRHSASFTLTPLAVGTDYKPRDKTGIRHPIGFRWTPAYGGVSGVPTLGQAISVSGAAASPNMGYHTSPVVAFLLTMFNARLGWWFPNPRAPTTSPSPKFSLKYLFCELFGVADDESHFLNISDGGHFENLAAYELIKRRCRVVIISDGECDPELKFEGLATLVRMCEVDGLATIEINVGSIRRSAGSQWSNDRCAIGKIIYPEDPDPGYLIYLKASMTGHEDTAIMQYKDTHPAFPHESTGDQFYDEAQFESYRNLGREVAVKTFGASQDRSNWVSKAEKLFEFFVPSLKDVGRFTEHADQLMKLWDRLAKDPTLQVFDGSFDNSLNAAGPGGRPFRALYFTCSQMLQLMENVYLDLDLENTWDHPDNAGWRNTFEKWAGSPAVRKTWDLSATTYGKRFQYFCERHLFKLPRE